MSMNKDSIFKKFKIKKAAKPAKKVYRVPTPNVEIWNSFALLILVATACWHLIGVSGWMSGKALVDLYGVNEVLATAIGRDPSILFNATYYAMAVSVIMLGITLVMLYLFLFDERDAYDSLKIVLPCSIITTWSFPIIHAATDLAATAQNIRDTSGFDVFQLGIDMTPMVVITAVCIVLMWLNKRINICIRYTARHA